MKIFIPRRHAIMVLALGLLILNGCDSKSPSPVSITDLWVGQADFYVNCESSPCKYRGSFGLELVENDDSTVTGEMEFTLLLIEELVQGAQCESFGTAREQITNGVVNGDQFRFNDPYNNLWELVFTRDIMEGVVTSETNDCDVRESLNSINVAITRSPGVSTSDDNTVSLTRRIVDQCDDKQRMFYRIFDVDSDMKWPEDGSYYTAEEFGGTNITSVTCIENNLICLGANTENGAVLRQTLGLNREQNWCLECCQYCRNGEIWDDQVICNEDLTY